MRAPATIHCNCCGMATDVASGLEAGRFIARHEDCLPSSDDAA